MPKNIIFSPFGLLPNSGGYNALSKNWERWIKINSDLKNYSKIEPEIIKNYSGALGEFITAIQKIMESNINSTSSPIHLLLHELVHGEKTLNTTKRIPKNKTQVALEVSDYAARNTNLVNEEVRCELRCKEILEGLSKKEKELLDYLS